MKRLIIIIIIGILASCSENDTNYSIIKETQDVNLNSASIDVKLKGNISEEELKNIALELREDRLGFKDIQIFYYLPFEGGENLWATSHFSPELEVKILTYSESDKIMKNRNEEFDIIYSDDEMKEIIKNVFKPLTIIPGKSLGRIELGMSKQEVKNIISYSENNDSWLLQTKDYEHFLRITFNDNVVTEINFSFPDYKTVEGFSTINHKNNPERFGFYISDRGYASPSTGIVPMDHMYLLKTGGLVFYDFDINNAEPDQRDLIFSGSIFIGDFPNDQKSSGWIKQGNEIEESLEDEYDG